MKKTMPALLALALLFTAACKKEKNGVARQLTADKTELRLTGEVNYTDSIVINANVPWTLSLGSAADWLEIDAVKGEGNAVVHLKNTKENNGNQNKEVVLTLNCTEDGIPPIQIKVSQKPYLKLLLSKILGGNDFDNLNAATPTADGGQILVGSTYSSLNGDVTTANLGVVDAWVVKLTSAGTVAWSKTLGGSSADQGQAISATVDGNYLVAGYSRSNDGDVTKNQGQGDYWIVKLNSSGNVIWSKTFGGTQNDQIASMASTQDGGCILLGSTYSNDGDVIGNHGEMDCWVTKISADGTKEWSKALGGSADDYGKSVTLVNSGGYLIAGYTESADGDVSGQHGSSDGWVVKLSNNGDLVWQKALGGTGSDGLNSILSLPGEEVLVCGFSNSTDGDISDQHGGGDGWVAKLGKNGDLQWSKMFGGTNAEYFNSMMANDNGGFLVTGYSYSDDGYGTGNRGQSDLWVLKINNKGEKVWLKAFGGSNSDSGWFFSRASDEKYWVGGVTYSTDGDITGQHGSNDGWMLQFE